MEIFVISDIIKKIVAHLEDEAALAVNKHTADVLADVYSIRFRRKYLITDIPKYGRPSLLRFCNISTREIMVSVIRYSNIEMIKRLIEVHGTLITNNISIFRDIVRHSSLEMFKFMYGYYADIPDIKYILTENIIKFNRHDILGHLSFSHLAPDIKYLNMASPDIAKIMLSQSDPDIIYSQVLSTLWYNAKVGHLEYFRSILSSEQFISILLKLLNTACLPELVEYVFTLGTDTYNILNAFIKNWRHKISQMGWCKSVINIGASRNIPNTLRIRSKISKILSDINFQKKIVKTGCTDDIKNLITITDIDFDTLIKYCISIGMPRTIISELICGKLGVPAMPRSYIDDIYYILDNRLAEKLDIINIYVHTDDPEVFKIFESSTEINTRYINFLIGWNRNEILKYLISTREYDWNLTDIHMLLCDNDFELLNHMIDSGIDVDMLVRRIDNFNCAYALDTYQNIIRKCPAITSIFISNIQDIFRSAIDTQTYDLINYILSFGIITEYDIDVYTKKSVPVLEYVHKRGIKLKWNCSYVSGEIADSHSGIYDGIEIQNPLALAELYAEQYHFDKAGAILKKHIHKKIEHLLPN